MPSINNAGKGMDYKWHGLQIRASQRNLCRKGNRLKIKSQRGEIFTGNTLKKYVCSRTTIKKIYLSLFRKHYILIRVVDTVSHCILSILHILIFGL